MVIVVTGAAGFIGYHVSKALLARGEQVFGIDNLNDYYDPKLKQARIGALEQEFGKAFASRAPALVRSTPSVRMPRKTPRWRSPRCA